MTATEKRDSFWRPFWRRWKSTPEECPRPHPAGATLLGMGPWGGKRLGVGCPECGWLDMWAT